MYRLQIYRASARKAFFVLAFLPLISFTAFSQGFLKADGKFIVNEKGEKIILRGMGLGGWMLQEGYMLKFPKSGQQHVIRREIEKLIGAEKTAEFYDRWLANHTRKIDVDSMKSWGFNSVRLAMHYNLYTLPIEEEPVKGQNTWLERGFAMTDSLLSWCKANAMYLILDLHAAPGGQGNDFNISDRDPSKPSLWDSEENQQKMIALWRRLAERYKDEPWIGAYDIINEPNWGFESKEDKNGLKEQKNEPLKKLSVEVSRAIREVDKKHIIIIEGNGWGNNYNGMLPPWDDNMVLSFHKYWNHNTQGSLGSILAHRDTYNVPVWLGETGENSNVWFTDAIRLLERNGIGWAWWPLKKVGFNNPLEIKLTPAYQRILDYWAGKGKQPSEEEAYKTLMEFAANTKLENCIYHKDVIDAMFRQVASDEAKPFNAHRFPSKEGVLAVDFDMGRHGIAYFDTDTTDYHVSVGGDFTPWNHGRVYRNDAVDIAMAGDGSYYVGHTEDGEWLQYSVDIVKPGQHSLKMKVASEKAGGKLSVFMNGDIVAQSVPVPNTGGKEKWQLIRVKDVNLKKGVTRFKVRIDKGGFNLHSIL